MSQLVYSSNKNRESFNLLKQSSRLFIEEITKIVRTDLVVILLLLISISVFMFLYDFMKRFFLICF